jgi:hypothetical protein
MTLAETFAGASRRITSRAVSITMARVAQPFAEISSPASAQSGRRVRIFEGAGFFGAALKECHEHFQQGFNERGHVTA